MSIFILCLKAFAAWLLADALSGLAHWVLDTQLVADGWFPGLVDDNERHHARPEAMLEYTIWQNMSTSLFALAAAGLFHAFGAPFIIWLSFVFLFFGNLVHRWAHERRNQVPPFVRTLQRLGIFQSPAHHALHHRSFSRLLSRRESFGRFCVMSNFVNTFIEFWTGPLA